MTTTSAAKPTPAQRKQLLQAAGFTSEANEIDAKLSQRTSQACISKGWLVYDRGGFRWFVTMEGRKALGHW